MVLWICGKSHAHHVHDPPREAPGGSSSSSSQQPGRSVSRSAPTTTTTSSVGSGSGRRRRSSHSGVGAFINYMFVSSRAQMDPVPAQVEVDGASIQGDGYPSQRRHRRRQDDEMSVAESIASLPTVSTLTLQSDMPMAMAVPARSLKKSRSSRSSSRGSSSGVSTRRINQARGYLPYQISDKEAIQLALLLASQEKSLGFNMFESLQRNPEDVIETDRLVASGKKYSDAVKMVFERRFGVINPRNTQSTSLVPSTPVTATLGGGYSSGHDVSYSNIYQSTSPRGLVSHPSFSSSAAQHPYGTMSSSASVSSGGSGNYPPPPPPAMPMPMPMPMHPYYAPPPPQYGHVPQAGSRPIQSMQSMQSMQSGATTTSSNSSSMRMSSMQHIAQQQQDALNAAQRSAQQQQQQQPPPMHRQMSHNMYAPRGPMQYPHPGHYLPHPAAVSMTRAHSMVGPRGQPMYYPNGSY